MAWTTYAAIYFVLWWVILFAILPWGVRSQQDHDAITPGTDPGAPATPHLRRKAIWTTVVSAVALGLFYAAQRSGFVTIESFATLWGLFPR